LQQASFKAHVNPLRKEYELRIKHGFDVDWLDGREVAHTFGFQAPAGILSGDGGEVDAYLLTHALLKDFLASGHHVYNNTFINDIDHQTKGVILHTDNGLKIHAKKLIIACGYESLKYVPKKIASIYSTYALVSEPLSEDYLWYKSSLVWETAEPITGRILRHP
jgi:glycine/D-amino acid oxidase-like deaminating enzyme